MKQNVTFSSHKFDNIDNSPFAPIDYSKLKFGSKSVARNFGRKLAKDFINTHSDLILSEKLIVIPSPYNYVPNAATLMTEHFYNRLNDFSVDKCGRNIEYATIQRKVSYTADYGFLPKEKRAGLLANDSFYLNKDYMRDKTIIFIDDVKITGTHEDKLKELLEKEKLDDNGHFFLYFAEFIGDRAEIESELNFADKELCPELLVNWINLGSNELIIRPMKYLLGLSVEKFCECLQNMDEDVVEKFYYNSIAEGYHIIPSYQINFQNLKHRFELEKN